MAGSAPVLHAGPLEQACLEVMHSLCVVATLLLLLHLVYGLKCVSWQELCRAGCSTFCVAPGSRSSPLAAAAAAQPRARLVPCIDERSLAFWALGHGAALIPDP